jgi:hypothetical protein
MSRTDGASWSHFLRASLTDTILEMVIFILETVIETLVASVKPGTSFETFFFEIFILMLTYLG